MFDKIFEPDFVRLKVVEPIVERPKCGISIIFGAFIEILSQQGIQGTSLGHVKSWSGKQHLALTERDSKHWRRTKKNYGSTC